MKTGMICVVSATAMATLGAMQGAAWANEPFLPRTERSFARLDADSDGRVTVNEWKPKAEKRFLRLDDDSNGTVTTAEIDTWLKRGFEKSKERMLSRLDQNKDGNITRDEVDAYVDALFNGADGDKDGGLTLAEIRDNAPKRMRQGAAKN